MNTDLRTITRGTALAGCVVLGYLLAVPAAAALLELLALLERPPTEPADLEVGRDFGCPGCGTTIDDCTMGDGPCCGACRNWASHWTTGPTEAEQLEEIEGAMRDFAQRLASPAQRRRSAR